MTGIKMTKPLTLATAPPATIADFEPLGADAYYTIPVAPFPEGGWTEAARDGWRQRNPDGAIWADIALVRLVSGPNKGRLAMIKWGGAHSNLSPAQLARGSHYARQVGGGGGGAYSKIIGLLPPSIASAGR